MIDTFTEFEDRYEKELNVSSEPIVITIDKYDYANSSSKLIVSYVIQNIKKILRNGYKDFNDNKNTYNVNYIDDLSDTQVIINADFYSIYWFSTKGESKGESIIGVEYSWPDNLFNGLTIGD